MRVTCSGAFSRRAANRPAKPPPMITTRREPDVAAMARPDLSLCIFIQAWIVMVIARGPLGIALMGVLPTPDHHDEHENRPRGWAVALPRCSGWVRPAIVVEYLNSPGVRDSFAGLEDQQVVAGHKGVRRAGHGLNGHRLAAAVRLQRVRPWIAFAFAGSVRASWNSTPSKTYRPPSILFGQGASSLPAPPGGSSSASYPAITGWPRNSSSRRPAPSSVTWRGRDLRRSGTAARSLPRSWRLRVRPGAAGGAPPAAPLSTQLRCPQPYAAAGAAAAGLVSTEVRGLVTC